MVDAGGDLVAEALRVIETNTYLTLATAGSDGTPWATPVWFAAYGLGLFVWASKPGARHSRQLLERPEVAISIFDSSVDPDDAAAVYVEATAAEVGPDEQAAALALFNTRAQLQGLPGWTAEKVSGAARHRLYRAQVQRLWVLDEHDERLRVDLTGD